MNAGAIWRGKKTSGEEMGKGGGEDVRMGVSMENRQKPSG